VVYYFINNLDRTLPRNKWKNLFVGYPLILAFSFVFLNIGGINHFLSDKS